MTVHYTDDVVSVLKDINRGKAPGDVDSRMLVDDLNMQVKRFIADQPIYFLNKYTRRGSLNHGEMQ